MSPPKSSRSPFETENVVSFRGPMALFVVKNWEPSEIKNKDLDLKQLFQHCGKDSKLVKKISRTLP